MGRRVPDPESVICYGRNMSDILGRLPAALLHYTDSEFCLRGHTNVLYM